MPSTGYNIQSFDRMGDGARVVSGQVAVTQATSITTGVTCNALTGVITTVSQTVAAGAEAEFTVTNNQVEATDVVVACIKTHTSAGSFIVACSAVADGSFKLHLTNLHASTAGNNVLVINFIVLKAQA
jgi:hypothetical protein